jgi:hypothetical protein
MPTARGKPVLRRNLLNDIADLSIEQEDDEFSSDCEDDSEDNFCEWGIKSSLYVLQMIKSGDRCRLVAHLETPVVFLSALLIIDIEKMLWTVKPAFLLPLHCT